MFFSAKNKGFFVELNDYGWLIARTSSETAPFVIELLAECPAGDVAAMGELIRTLLPKKTPSGYLHATTSFYPSKRLVRRASIDLKRVKEPAYLNEIITQQFRIEPEKYTVAVLQATDGSDYEVVKATQKEALFCGTPSEDISAFQGSLLAAGIYPERVELASVAGLGAVVDYMTFKRSKSPTLVLEINDEATHTYIVSTGGVEAARPIPQGLSSMIPVVQKELNLKDEESAKRLFHSNTFDFAGMGPLLIKKLLKELQSSIGFYEVQTGQSIGQVLCTMVPPKLTWLESAIANALGVPILKLDIAPWLQARQVTVSDQVAATGLGPRWLGLLGLMTHYKLTPANHAVVAEKKS